MRRILLIFGILLSVVILSGSNSCNDRNKATGAEYAGLFIIEGSQEMLASGNALTTMVIENKHTGKKYIVVRGPDSVAICPE